MGLSRGVPSFVEQHTLDALSELAGVPIVQDTVPVFLLECSGCGKQIYALTVKRLQWLYTAHYQEQHERNGEK